MWLVVREVRIRIPISREKSILAELRRGGMGAEYHFLFQRCLSWEVCAELVLFDFTDYIITVQGCVCDHHYTVPSFRWVSWVKALSDLTQHDCFPFQWECHVARNIL